MGRLAVAVLLLLVLLEIVCRAHSASNADPATDAKASLASGEVPASQLGSEVANASTCRNGNSTWGACGGGSPAGITYATTAHKWTQTILRTLTGGTLTEVKLIPCPTGVDTTSGDGYQVLISGGGNSEVVEVVSGSCVSGAPSGTITFTPYYSYPAGSSVGSASSGIQETLNAACGVDPTSLEKLPMQRHHPGERPRLSTLDQHVQCSWNDLSALKPIGVERLWSFSGLHRTWSLPAGWQSDEFRCIRKQYRARSQFPYANELLEQPRVCGSGDHENAAVVAVGDDHDGYRARLSAG